MPKMVGKLSSKGGKKNKKEERLVRGGQIDEHCDGCWGHPWLLFGTSSLKVKMYIFGNFGKFAGG